MVNDVNAESVLFIIFLGQNTGLTAPFGKNPTRNLGMRGGKLPQANILVKLCKAQWGDGLPDPFTPAALQFGK